MKVSPVQHLQVVGYMRSAVIKSETIVNLVGHIGTSLPGRGKFQVVSITHMKPKIVERQSMKPLSVALGIPENLGVELHPRLPKLTVPRSTNSPSLFAVPSPHETAGCPNCNWY